MTKWLCKKVAVSPQITPGDVVFLKRDGFSRLVCNRPDHEEMGQPDAASVAAVAEAQGMDFTHLPIGGEGITLDAAKAFRTAMEEGDGPMLAYCRSGTRCCVLWAIASAIDTPPQEVLRCAKEAGYDLSHMAGLFQSLFEVGGFPEV